MTNFTHCVKQCLLIIVFTLLGNSFVSAQTPTYFKGIGTSSNNIPLKTGNGGTHCQHIYTPTEFNTLPPSGPITKVYMRNNTASESGVFANFSISFLQNNLSVFPDNTFLTGFTNALTATSITITGNATAGGWFEIPLDVPFMYDNTKSLVYEIKYTTRTGGIATLNTSTTGVNKRLSIIDAPGPTTGNLASTWMDFGFDILANPCSGTPVPGSSTASPSVACAASQVTLGLSGNTLETNLTYTWQSSTLIGGPYTDISTPATAPSLNITASTTKYYRCAVSCSGNTPVYSTPVLLNVNPQFPGNTYTINGSLPTGGLNFNNFTDAFNAINCGVLGKVIFNVPAGQVFMENPPVLQASGTVTDSIIFQKTGSGQNPLIQPAVAGTIASSTTLGADGDAVITINGGDYIKFDGIDLTTSTYTSGNDQYEYGYYLKKKSPTDACKHVTIKNAVITLNKSIYSFGIYVSNNSATAAVTVTSVGGASEDIRISGNTINSSYGGICVRGQATEAYFDQQIQIGVDSGNIVNEYAGGGSIGYGIYAISQNNLKIAKNTVVGFNGGQTTTLYGIYIGAAVNANTEVYNNTVTIHGTGGTTTSIYAIHNLSGGTGTNNLVKLYNNTITGCTYSSATTGDLYLISQDATAYNVEIYGNTLTNNTLAGTTTAFNMIYQSGAVINSSKIYNNTISGNSKTAGTTGATYGIYSTSAATSNNLIYGNSIDNITVTNTSGLLTGINVLTSASAAVYNNKIFGLTNTASTTGPVYGITLGAGGLVNNVYNNFISDLNAPTSTTTGTTTTDLIRGINITSTTALSTQNVSFNTILLNASGGAIFSTSGIFHTTSATATTSALNLRNNIIVNYSTPSGIGFASAIRRSSANVLGNYGSASNNNLFFVNSGTNRAVFYDGTNNDVDLSLYKTRVAPRESASISENPNFVNSSGTPYDLHINPLVPTQIESGGIAVTGITLDFDGNTRHATTPDLGADEFTGTTADLTGPTISYTDLSTQSICMEAKTISATITDASNINVAAGTKPRLWFKKASENDALPATNTAASNGWKYVEASNSASPFSFTFNFALLNTPLTYGDSISYFIVAQDMASTPNVGVSVATFNSSATTVALSSVVFPVSGNIKGFSLLTQPNPIAIKSSRVDLCNSGTVILNVDNVNVSGGTYQWQSSPRGLNLFTDIPGATTVPFTTANITDSTDFRLIVKCGGTPIASSPSPIFTVNVNKPLVTGTTRGYYCGAGSSAVSLNATAKSGNVLNWYSSATGGTPIFTGSPFVTPPLSATTTYYVSAEGGNGGLSSTGLAVVTASPTSGSGTTAFGMVFDALTTFTLQSVNVYPTSATDNLPGTVTIDVLNSSGTVINTATVNVIANTAANPVAQTVMLNFTIPAGTNYLLRHSARSSGISGLLFGPSPSSTYNFGYPFVVPGIVSINTSTNTFGGSNVVRNDLYYYFYDWQVVTGCQSARVAVDAVIDHTAGCTLPVSIVKFAGEKRGNYNKLSWSTATETNNNGFELQRSVDGINFSSLAFINTKAINGNSNAVIEYGFDDALPTKGHNYYRLKQVDKDGAATFSNIVLLKGDKVNTVQLIAVYPNPVKETLNIKVAAPQAQKATLIVTDAAGKTVMQQGVQLLNGENNFKLTTLQLSQGTYFIKVTCENGCQTALQKFIRE